jgi:hypothetical protein
VALLLILVAAVVVVVIALVAVGREALTLRTQPRHALFDLDEAVDHVADHLPFEVSARLSYDDVRQLLVWHLDLLRDEGVPDDRAAGAATGPTVVADTDAAIAPLLAQALADGLDVDERDVRAVLDGANDYLRAIGAVGGEIG